MARASKGDIWEKANSAFARRLSLLMNKQPTTTQAQLAEITSKTRQTISQYVNGMSEPGYDTLVKIADHFSVSTDYLLGRTSDPYPNGTAMEDLGISTNAAEQFRSIKTTSILGKEYLDSANQMLEDDEFWNLMFTMHEYTVAAKADVVFNNLLVDQGFNNLISNYGVCIDSIKHRLVEMASDYYSAGEYEMYDFLIARANSLSQDDTLERLCLSDYTLAELYTLRINRQLEKTLSSLCKNNTYGVD